MSEATKACPYCGETILAVARKCKHCREYLDAPAPSGPGWPEAGRLRPASADWSDEDYDGPRIRYRPAAFRRPYAWFVLFYGFACFQLLLAVVFGALAGWQSLVGSNAFNPRWGHENFAALDRAEMFGIIALIWLILASVIAIPSIVPFFVFLYRSWNLIQDGTTRPTAGRAVGFLFIPFFNFYWIFPAIHGLATRLNSYAQRHGIVIRPVPTGQALAYCILTVCSAVPFVNVVVLIPQAILLFRLMRSLKDATTAIAEAEWQGEALAAPGRSWGRFMLILACLTAVILSALAVQWSWPKEPQLVLCTNRDLIHRIVFRADGNRLVCASRNVTVWDATPTSGRAIRDSASFEFEGPPGSTALYLSPDGRRAVFAVAGPNWDDRFNRLLTTDVRVFETETGKELWALGALRGVVRSAAFSRDGNLLATVGHDSGIRGGPVATEVKLWDLTTGQELLVLEEIALWVTCLALSPDGRQLATAGGNSVIRIWDTSNGKEVRTIHTSFSRIHDIAFSPDGKQLACSYGPGGQVKVYDCATTQEVQSLEVQEYGVYAPVFSPDGRYLACYDSGGNSKVWDLASGRPAFTFKGRFPAFSPDSKRIATLRGRQIHIWDVPGAK